MASLDPSLDLVPPMRLNLQKDKRHTLVVTIGNFLLGKSKAEIDAMFENSDKVLETSQSLMTLAWKALKDAHSGLQGQQHLLAGGEIRNEIFRQLRCSWWRGNASNLIHLCLGLDRELLDLSASVGWKTLTFQIQSMLSRQSPTLREVGVLKSHATAMKATARSCIHRGIGSAVACVVTTKTHCFYLSIGMAETSTLGSGDAKPMAIRHLPLA